MLKPENKAYPVIRPEGALEIFGVMVGCPQALTRRVAIDIGLAAQSVSSSLGTSTSTRQS